MLPLRFIKVSNKRNDVKQFDVSIPATRIVALMSTGIYQARRSIHDEKKAGTLINACGTSAAKTAIILDNGVVVASPLSVSVIMNQIDKSNYKENNRNQKRLKVYDVYDEEPNESIDEDVPDILGYDDEDTDDEDDY